MQRKLRRRNAENQVSHLLPDVVLVSSRSSDEPVTLSAMASESEIRGMLERGELDPDDGQEVTISSSATPENFQETRVPLSAYQDISLRMFLARQSLLESYQRLDSHPELNEQFLNGIVSSIFGLNSLNRFTANLATKKAQHDLIKRAA